MIGMVALGLLELGASLGFIQSEIVERRKAFLRTGKEPKQRLNGAHQALVQLRRSKRPLNRTESFFVSKILSAVRWFVNSDTAEELVKLAVVSGPPLNPLTMNRRSIPNVHILTP